MLALGVLARRRGATGVPDDGDEDADAEYEQAITSGGEHGDHGSEHSQDCCDEHECIERAAAVGDATGAYSTISGEVIFG